MQLRSCTVTLASFSCVGSGELAVGAISRRWERKRAKGSRFPLGDIYDQSSTEWCWAFSAFHTLRTYNSMPMPVTTSAAAWSGALRPLDSQQDFWSFMESRYDYGNAGDPNDFIALMKRDNRLPSETGSRITRRADRCGRRGRRLRARYPGVAAPLGQRDSCRRSAPTCASRFPRYSVIPFIAA